MKKMTKEEFLDRVTTVAWARKIFIPHVTRNVSIAFELYQEVLAEKERIIKLSKVRTRDFGPLGTKQRPLCPKCGNELFLRIIDTPQGKQNVFGWRTCWVCEMAECYHEDFSTKTLEDWLEELKPKEETENGNEIR